LNFPDFQVGIDSIRRNTPEGVINKIIFINQNEDHKPQNVDIEIKSKNLGFAKAMNTGLRLSDAEYVMCLNDDVVFINKQWWQGILDTFRDYSTALCVNPSSPCDPDGMGATIIKEGFEYKTDYSDEEYQKLVNPHVIDGICMWGPVFKRSMLDKVPGVIPGKAWFDERFLLGGGEDYDLNRRGFLANMRSLGSGKSYVWHWWFKTVRPDTGVSGVKDDGPTFHAKWGADADIYGNSGIKEIPPNIIRD
jgi:GT2 family glycosyltransferase